jgi:hypothetical protein
MSRRADRMLALMDEQMVFGDDAMEVSVFHG